MYHFLDGTKIFFKITMLSIVFSLFENNPMIVSKI